MFTDRFLRYKRGVSLSLDERATLEASIAEVQTLDARKIVVRAGMELDHSTLLIEGILSR